MLKTKEQLLAELEDLHKKSKEKEAELIAANQQLQASEQQLRASETSVRRKLTAITEPDGDLSKLELSDILDAATLQSLMENLSGLTGMCSGIADLKGNVLASVGWRDVCKNFHRSHPEAKKNCIESDTILSSGIAPGEFKLYRCKNHMWEAASPITIAGQHMGNVFFGQFFYDDEELDEVVFSKQAKRFNFDKQEYLTALNAVPRYSRKEAEHAIRFFAEFSRMISAQSYSNLVLSRSLSERKMAEETLQATNQQMQASEQQLRAANQQLEATNQQLKASEAELHQKQYHLENAQELGKIGSWDLDIAKNELVWTDENYRIFGIPIGTPMTYDLFLDRVHPEDREYVHKKWSAAMQGEEAYDITHRLKMDNGEVKWLREKADLVFDDAGKCVRGTGFAQDITVSKLSEQNLRNSERRLKESQTIAALGNFEQNIETGQLWWSDEVYNILEFDRDKQPPTAQEFSERLDDENADKLNGFMQKVIATDKADSLTYKFYTPSSKSYKYISTKTETYTDEQSNARFVKGTIQDVTERKEAEERIKQSEEKFRELYNQSPIAIQHYDTGGNLLDVNKKTLELYGISNAKEIASFNFLESPKLSNEQKAELQKGNSVFISDILDFNVIKEHKYFETEKTGKRYVELLVAPLVSNKKIIAYLVHMLDVTERLQAEEKIKLRDLHLRSLVENPVGYIIYRTRFNRETGQIEVVQVSPSCTEILSISEEGRNDFQQWFQYVHPEDLPKLMEASNAGMSPPFILNIEVRYNHPLEGLKWLEIRANGIPYGDDPNMIEYANGIILDITEQKHAEEELRKSEAKFRSVFEDTNVGIALGSAEGTVIEVNEEYLKITGYTRDEFINLNYAEITHPEDLAKEIPLLEKLQKGEIDHYRLEKRLLAKNGEYRWLDVAVSCQRNTDGYINLTIALVVDIHESKRANETINVFFEQPMNIHLIGSIQGEITKVNEGWLQTLGYSREDTLGKNIMDFIHPDDVESTINELKELENGKTTFYFENRYKHKNGSYITLAWSAIYNTSGKMLHGVAKDITKQKAYQDELRKSEERYKALSENAKHIILTHTLQGEITYANKFAVDFINLPKEQIIGLSIEDLVKDEQGKEEMRQRVEGFVQCSQNIHQYELQITLPSGKEHLLEIVGSQINPQDPNSQVLITAYDITERKRAENIIRESEEKLKLIIENSPLGICISDMEGNFTLSNPAYEKMLGYTKDEMEKLSFFDITHPDYHTENRSKFQNMTTGNKDGFEIEKKYIKKDGTIIDVLVHAGAIHDDKGEATFGLALIEDITEKKKTQQQLLESEAKFRSYVDNGPEGIFIVDETGKHQEVNKAASIITGYSEEELLNMHILDLLQKSELEKGEQHFKEVQEKGNASRELGFVTKKGEHRYWNVSAVKLSETRLMGFAKDITQRKIAEQDLIKAKEKAEESDRLKSAFLSNMSHEIRTPMNGILGFTGLLKEPQLSGDKKDQYIKIIEKSGQRMLNTINDIVDISKIEAGQVEVSKKELSINKILNEQFNFFAQEANIKGLEINYQPLIPNSESCIVSDQFKLESILTNLIKNAIKFTESGSINFGCTIKSLKGKGVCEFYVKDTGIGIPANRIDAIFNRFEQADIEDTRVFEGSGLGLAISKSYVEMLGGSIGVSSIEGKGTTFTFHIPFTKPCHIESVSNQSSQQEPEFSLNNLSIIVAEDDDVSKLLLTAILENKFGEISYTSTGKETIEKCRKNPDSDIILMDIKMPDMNGFEATRKIREFNKDVIIIAQTAYGLTGDKEKAIEAGCNDYIAKPINKKRLFEMIWNCLNKKSI